MFAFAKGRRSASCAGMVRKAERAGENQRKKQKKKLRLSLTYTQFHLLLNFVRLLLVTQM